MINRIARWIADSCDISDPEEYEIVAYGLECRISDLMQILLLTACGYFLRCFLEVLCFGLSFTLLKRQVGGYHCATHFTCITLFSAVATAASLLAKWATTGLAEVVTALCVSLSWIAVYWFSPIAHPNHPKSKAAHKQSRKSSVRIATLQLILLPIVVLRFSTLGVAGGLGALFAASTLVIAARKEGLT